MDVDKCKDGTILLVSKQTQTWTQLYCHLFTRLWFHWSLTQTDPSISGILQELLWQPTFNKSTDIILAAALNWPKCVVLPKGLSHHPQPLWSQHQVLVSCLALLKIQQALVFLCCHRARLQQDQLPGRLCEQPQCPQEGRGVLGHPPSRRVKPYGGKPPARSQTRPPSPQVCNGAGLSQAGVFDIEFTEAGPLVPPLSAPQWAHQGVCLTPLLTDQSCTLNCHQGWAGCQRELWFKQPVLQGRKDQPGHSCPRTQYISLWAEQGWRRESLCPGCLHAEQRGSHTAPGKQDGGVIKPHCLLLSFHSLN